MNHDSTNLKLNISKMTISSLPINSLILGCIDNIKDYELSLCLPSGIRAKVDIANISQKYSNLLSNYSDYNENNKCPHKPSSLFRIGQCLPVKILNKTDSSTVNDQSSVTYVSISGSIKPDDINENINRSAFFSKYACFTLSASVNSIEEHGYIMDIGFKGLSGFLSDHEAETFLKSNEQSKLLEGQVLSCSILSASEKIITLTTKSIKKDSLLKKAFEMPFSCLLPGLKVNAVVIDITDIGLEVIIFNIFKGFVHRDYLSSIWDLPKEDYQIGQAIKGIILYVNPFNQVISLTMRKKPSPSLIKKFFSGLYVGQIFEKAITLGRDDKDNFIFKLTDELKGLAPKNELSDHFLTTEDLALIETNLPIGSEQKCRIKSIFYLDGIVKLSLKPSLLEAEDVSIDSLEVGSIVKGTIFKLTQKGLVLKLGSYLKAFCPTLHLFESTQGVKSEKHFPLGKCIKCRVLHLDKTLVVPKIIVTCRKSLMSEKLTILDDVKKSILGFQTSGVVIAVRKNGLLIEFFNQIKGWIPSQQLNLCNIETPESCYRIGQILSVVIVDRDIKTNYITLSLASNSQKNLKFDKKNYEIGKVIKNCVIESKRQNGFFLSDKSEYSIFLPKHHLSDNPTFFNHLYNTLNVGDIIEEVVVFKFQFEIIVVSKKSVFIDAAKNNLFALDKFEVDCVVPAFVTTIKPYGIFLELPNNLIGLVPTKFIGNNIKSPEESGFLFGQTLMARIKSIETVENQKKILFSTKLSDVLKMDYSFICKLLFFHLKEVSLIKRLKSSYNQSKSFGHILLGDIVNYQILETSNEYLICQVFVDGIKKNIKGLICLKNNDLSQKLLVGSLGQAVVLDTDVDDQLVYLCVDSRLLKNVQQKKLNLFDQIFSGQTIVSTVRFISQYYIIASLEAPHALGAFVHIPNISHLNLIMSKCQIDVYIGKKIKVMIEKKTNIDCLNGPTYIIGTIVNTKMDLKQIHKDYRKEKMKQYKLKRKQDKIQSFIFCKVRKKEKKDSEDQNLEMVIALNKEANENQICIDETQDYGAKKYKNVSTFLSSKNQDETNKQSVSKKKKKKLFKQMSLKQTNEVKFSSLFIDDQFDWDLSSITGTNFQNESQEILEKNEQAQIGSIENKSHKKSKSKNKDKDDKIEVDYKNEKQKGTKSNQIIVNEPLSKEEFEELVKKCSHDSKNWLMYVQFYVNQAEIEKAKEICNRALEAISYREEKHKLRIWIKLLNIEYKHGTMESLDELFKQALKCNDELKLYQAMIKIYEDDKKFEPVELLYKELIKKFSMSKQVWIDFGHFYMKRNFKDLFRKLYQRCINTLDKTDHIDISSKFAQLEFQFGEIERGKSLFESIIVEHPKRCDIWSVYIDMMVKYGISQSSKYVTDVDSIESIRMLFERVISLKFKPKRMNFFFQKYFDFEKKFGDKKKIINIKKKAQEYVEKIKLHDE